MSTVRRTRFFKIASLADRRFLEPYGHSHRGLEMRMRVRISAPSADERAVARGRRLVVRAAEGIPSSSAVQSDLGKSAVRDNRQHQRTIAPRDTKSSACRPLPRCWMWQGGHALLGVSVL